MKVKFIPQNIEIEVTADKSLLQICNENKIRIRSICKGVPSCAECRIRIVEGENSAMPPTPAELALIGSSYYLDGRRLSCQVHCFGPMTVDLTEQNTKHETSSKKLRGFKSQKPMESKAIQDTMILSEKNEDKDKN
ncbi:MAG: 2Fe-2S iron-sulfur cluster binding domain-containing protein [Bdellovibrionota bacterium]